MNKNYINMKSLKSVLLEAINEGTADTKMKKEIARALGKNAVVCPKEFRSFKNSSEFKWLCDNAPAKMKEENDLLGLNDIIAGMAKWIADNIESFNLSNDIEQWMEIVGMPEGDENIEWLTKFYELIANVYNVDPAEALE